MRRGEARRVGWGAKTREVRLSSRTHRVLHAQHGRGPLLAASGVRLHHAHFLRRFCCVFFSAKGSERRDPVVVVVAWRQRGVDFCVCRETLHRRGVATGPVLSGTLVGQIALSWGRGEDPARRPRGPSNTKKRKRTAMHSMSDRISSAHCCRLFVSRLATLDRSGSLRTIVATDGGSQGEEDVLKRFRLVSPRIDRLRCSDEGGPIVSDSGA